MTFTKTLEQKQARWDHLAKLKEADRVMTRAEQLNLRNKQKKEAILQEMAERVLNALTSPGRVSNAPMGSIPQVKEVKVVPEANVILSAKKKVDTLALKADAIIKELQGV